MGVAVRHRKPRQGLPDRQPFQVQPGRSSQKGGQDRCESGPPSCAAKLEDWERAEDHATPYTLAQIERFSPKSRAILEIQSARDLEILEKIYANGVLLGDDGRRTGGASSIRQGEFHMTNDSRLFPPRPQWEAKGYRPDEYSRWLLGDWRPIEELWAELGVDPSRPEPAEIELEDWLFDTTAGPERRQAEAQFVHGHLLKPGDVARTNWRVRCAQPPYDRLPVARAKIPSGVILSREGDSWIQEGVQHTALPFFEGRMIGQFDFSEKGWVSGKGRSAVWREISPEHKQVEPQYLMGKEHHEVVSSHRQGRDHGCNLSSTNTRTMIVTPLAGDSLRPFHWSVELPSRTLRPTQCSVEFDRIRFRLTSPLLWLAHKLVHH